MGIIPEKYMSELYRSVRRKWEDHDSKPMSGWLALSPLMIFLCIYLLSSIITKDFYSIPISAAFLIAAAYGILICRGRSLEQRISVFSEGAGVLSSSFKSGVQETRVTNKIAKSKAIILRIIIFLSYQSEFL